MLLYGKSGIKKKQPKPEKINYKKAESARYNSNSLDIFATIWLYNVQKFENKTKRHKSR